jgi:hypothetical protein
MVRDLQLRLFLDRIGLFHEASHSTLSFLGEVVMLLAIKKKLDCLHDIFMVLTRTQLNISIKSFKYSTTSTSLLKTSPFSFFPKHSVALYKYNCCSINDRSCVFYHTSSAYTFLPGLVRLYMFVKDKRSESGGNMTYSLTARP